jgi:hypothetical protein
MSNFPPINRPCEVKGPADRGSSADHGLQKQRPGFLACVPFVPEATLEVRIQPMGQPPIPSTQSSRDRPNDRATARMPDPSEECRRRSTLQPDLVADVAAQSPCTLRGLLHQPHAENLVWCRLRAKLGNVDPLHTSPRLVPCCWARQLKSVSGDGPFGDFAPRGDQELAEDGMRQR